MQNRIKQTKAFKGLDAVQNSVYNNRKQLQVIRTNYFIAIHKGFEEWVKNASPGPAIKNIVAEMLSDDEEKDLESVFCECGEKAKKGFDPACSLKCWIEQFN